MDASELLGRNVSWLLIAVLGHEQITEWTLSSKVLKHIVSVFDLLTSIYLRKLWKSTLQNPWNPWKIYQLETKSTVMCLK